MDEGELLMATQAFDPKFMKVGVLTGPAGIDPARSAIRIPIARSRSGWSSRELGADYIQLSLHPTETDVPPEAMLDPVANTLDLRKPFDKDRAARVKRVLQANRSACRMSATSTTCCTTIRRCGRSTSSCATFDAAVLLGVDAVCGFVGRNPAHDGREPDRLRAVVRSAAEGGQGARAHLSGRAVPDAGLDDRRHLAQQHRLHARDLDRPAQDLRSTASAISSGSTTRHTRS